MGLLNAIKQIRAERREFQIQYSNAKRQGLTDEQAIAQANWHLGKPVPASFYNKTTANAKEYEEKVVIGQIKSSVTLCLGDLNADKRLPPL